MKGYVVKTKEEAFDLALQLIPEKSSVAYGGSRTLLEIGLLDYLKTSGKYDVVLREGATTLEEKRAIAARQVTSDWFLMSTNAITEDGVLVNIDGTSNRVSYLCYGPENVLIIAGKNKVVTDLEAAIDRAKNVASPPNARRLNRKTPCAVTNKCNECQSPDCICCQTVITRRGNVKDRIKVILVEEELGF